MQLFAACSSRPTCLEWELGRRSWRPGAFRSASKRQRAGVTLRIGPFVVAAARLGPRHAVGSFPTLMWGKLGQMVAPGRRARGGRPSRYCSSSAAEWSTVWVTPNRTAKVRLSPGARATDQRKRSELPWYESSKPPSELETVSHG